MRPWRSFLRPAAGVALAVSCLAAAPPPHGATGMPARKPGWWALEMTVIGPTPAPMRQSLHICTDPAIDKVQSPFGVHQGSKCPAARVTAAAGGWEIAASCLAGGMTVATTGRLTGDLASHYHVDLLVHMTPPPTPATASVKIGMDATWLGPCPAGKKPGDVEMNMTTNLAPPAR